MRLSLIKYKLYLLGTSDDEFLFKLVFSMPQFLSL